jgi:hypothetical protein
VDADDGDEEKDAHGENAGATCPSTTIIKPPDSNVCSSLPRRVMADKGFGALT